MKTSILSVLAVLISVTSAHARDRVDNRQIRQQARIHAGKESGEITQRAAARSAIVAVVSASASASRKNIRPYRELSLLCTRWDSTIG